MRSDFLPAAVRVMAITGCLVLMCCLPLHASPIIVSPAGNDAWSGRLAEPNAAATDGPFASIHRAREAIRGRRREQPPAEGPVVVQLRGGTYRLQQPLTFGPEDSGTIDSPTVYMAFPGEKPIISGGRRIVGWQRLADDVWAAGVPWAATLARPLCQLFVDGRRRPRARLPDEGSYFYSKRLLLTEAKTPQCLGLIAAPGDLPRLSVPDAAVVCLFHNWVNSYNYLGKVEWERRRLRFARPAGIFFLGPRVRYYVENAIEGFDAPGEWFLDEAAGRLLYRPLSGEVMSTVEVIAPVVPQTLVRIQGDPVMGIYVEHLHFRGLSFQHTGADLSRTYRHSVQGAVHQRGAILAVGLRHSRLSDCEFTRLGEHAVSLREACADNRIERCHIHDIGGGGVYLSEGAPGDSADTFLTVRTTVDNNFIHDGGHIFRAGCGVFLGGSESHNQITHNEICDLSWMGVHLGWSWTAKARAYTHHNEIGYNHIHHIGNGVLCDIGGIYTLGVSPGTVLHHNRIHDVTRFHRGSQGYGGWGIYLDAGSSEITVRDNVVYDTQDGGFHAHCDNWPYGNTITNNIFAYADSAQMRRNNVDDPETYHLKIERNIIHNRGPQMFGGGNWKADSRFSSNHNCFWSDETLEPDFYGKALAEWRTEGRDLDSIVADPGFLAPEKRDFRLRPDSPALSVGFCPIDISSVGLYGDAAWTRLPLGIIRRVVEKARPDALENASFEDDLTLGAVGEAQRTWEALSFQNTEFGHCTWVGFAGMDEKVGRFYVDDVRLE